MAYVVPADFRTETVQSWTAGLTLSASEASDPLLTSTIGAVGAFIDTYCSDHFEPENTKTLYAEGRGQYRLYIPRRIRAITSVSLRNSDGSYTAQTGYVVTGSALAAATEADVDRNGSDFLTPGPQLYGWTYGLYATKPWPFGPRSVQVIGDFSWPVVPVNIKRAAAILVWDWVKPSNNDPLKRAISVNSLDQTITLASIPPEAERLLMQYQRSPVMVA